jgi:hypothetical protein
MHLQTYIARLSNFQLALRKRGYWLNSRESVNGRAQISIDLYFSSYTWGQHETGLLEPGCMLARTGPKGMLQLAGFPSAYIGSKFQ